MDYTVISTYRVLGNGCSWDIKPILDFNNNRKFVIELNGGKGVNYLTIDHKYADVWQQDKIKLCDTADESLTFLTDYIKKKWDT